MLSLLSFFGTHFSRGNDVLFIAVQDQRLRTLSLSESFFDLLIVLLLKTAFSLVFHQTSHYSQFPFLILHWSLPRKCHLIIIICFFLDPLQEFNLGHMTVLLLFGISLYNCNDKLEQSLWNFKAIFLKMGFLYLVCITCSITKYMFLYLIVLYT